MRTAQLGSFIGKTNSFGDADGTLAILCVVIIIHLRSGLGGREGRKSPRQNHLNNSPGDSSKGAHVDS
jgi:hypothetical protein